jgi:exodeoxyribonuclease VII large subunit
LLKFRPKIAKARLHKAAKLQKEGLFDDKIKRPIPILPDKIFLITSPTGAAVQDFIKIAQKHNTFTEIIIVPTLVQGENATKELIQAVNAASVASGPRDVIVLARGGGSMEDLSAFNDEDLARAIRNTPVPVISAIGHETDFTIADFVADLRAPTPTAAASILFQPQDKTRSDIANLTKRMFSALTNILTNKRHMFEKIAFRLSAPETRLVHLRLELDDATHRLAESMLAIMTQCKKRYETITLKLEQLNPAILTHNTSARLKQLDIRLENAMRRIHADRKMAFTIFSERLNSASPLNLLARGYSLVQRDEDGLIIRHASDVKPGDILSIRPQTGQIKCQVTEIRRENET